MLISALRRVFGVSSENGKDTAKEPTALASAPPQAVSIEQTVGAIRVANAAGGYAEALRLANAALRARPGDPQLELMRSATLLAWGRKREAGVGLLRLAADEMVETRQWGTLGICLLAAGYPKEAEPWLRKAAERGDSDAQTALAQCLQKQDRIIEAVAQCDDMLGKSPGDHRAMLLKAQCLVILGQAEAGANCLRRIVDDNPRDWIAWFNLGIAHRAMRRHEEALADFEQAHQSRGAGVTFDTATDLAMAYHATGNPDRAIAVLEESLRTTPSIEGHRTYGQFLLASGRMPEGWTYYEFRWMLAPLVALRGPMRMPAWKGQDLTGKTFLVRVEQGLGDVIQFMRYAPMLRALGARVVVAGFSELAPYFAGVDHVLAAGDDHGKIDFYANLLSLPRAFNTDLTSIPESVPYVGTDPAKVAEWQQRLAHVDGLRVGLVWAGSPKHPADRQRSVGLGEISSLLDIVGASFFALQKGRPVQQIDSLGLSARLTALDSDMNDLCDTAAAISQMDLVISVDTSVAHLAGALGKAVWTLVAEPADWRWLHGRDDTPWYPSMRLFRQRQPGDWREVVERVKAALDQLISDREPKGQAAIAPSCSLLAPRSTHEIRQRDDLGFGAVTETADGIMQFLPDEPLVGESLTSYGEYLRVALDSLAPCLSPGMTVLEADAGIGTHALSLARQIGPSGHLFLFEVRHVHRQILQQNLAANSLSNATVLGSTLVDETVNNGRDDPRRDTIDGLLLDRLDWIKLRPETATLAVIRGAQETLWRLRPKLHVGVGDDDSAVALASALREFGYRCWRIETPMFRLDNFNRVERDVFAGRMALAVVASPEEADDQTAAHGGVEIT